MSKPEGYDAAIKAVQKNQTPRYQALNKLEQYVETTQYDHRDKDWLDDSCNKPLWERRPSIAYPIVQAAIRSNVDLVLGQGRFPDIKFPAEEKSELNSEISKLLKRCRFKTACKQALEEAEGCGTAVAIVGVRNEKVFIDLVKAKWCEPKFGKSGEVTELEIRYPYIDLTKEHGKHIAKAKIYRRKITDQEDITYKPAVATEDPDAKRDWVRDENLTVKHKLGFCPVVWYKHLAGVGTVNCIDGEAIHNRCLDEITALDFTLSHRHRCAIKLEPQICEFGVAPGFIPTETGRPAEVRAAPGKPKDLTNPEDLEAMVKSGQTYNDPTEGSGSGAARKKGPGFVWQYPNEKSSVEMLELSPNALQALTDHAHDLRLKIQESMSVVFMDPDNLKFAAALSGKALSMLKQRQLDRCDWIRDDFSDGFMVPALLMGIQVGLKKDAVELSGSVEEVIKDPGLVEVKWGPYFKADVEEESKLTSLAIMAIHQLGLPAESVLPKVGRVYGIEDIESIASLIEKKAEENKETDE